jgi:hypothetical protein
MEDKHVNFNFKYIAQYLFFTAHTCFGHWILPSSGWNIEAIVSKYRVIKKSLWTWWLQQRKLQVMFKVSTAGLQTFIDTPNCVLEDRVQYSAVQIPNVFCDGHFQIIVWGIVGIPWVLHHYLAQPDCLAADRQGQGDTRLTLTPSVIPNSNYVITVSDWLFKMLYFCVFFML